jgi:nucleoside-diphosphate-sugar epimerase
MVKKVLIVGNLGYVGPEVVKILRKSNTPYHLSGYDVGYFVQNVTTNGLIGDCFLDCQYYGDARDLNEKLLEGIDAVVYLAAISNDPMGNVYEQPTLEINWHAAIRLAEKAKKKGVRSFVFASSCSVYGFADTAPRTEQSETNPLTAYARSKVSAEKDLRSFASEDFMVTCLRFATACGFSDRLRLDLVLNDFVASAIADKKITILSDGSPWRPLIHVQDMGRAIDWAINRSNGDQFLIVNTGSNEWNYQVKDLAFAVRDYFGNVEVQINPNAQPDKRSYKVSFDLFKKLAPDHQPKVGLKDAIAGLKKGLEEIHFNDPNFRQSYLIRLKSLQKLISESIIDASLRRNPNAA